MENTELTLSKLKAELHERTHIKLVHAKMQNDAKKEKAEKLHAVVATEKLLAVAKAQKLHHLALWLM